MKQTPERWRRRVERAGVWWAEARDGAWSRWDPRRADWVTDRAGPGGTLPPLVATAARAPATPEAEAPDLLGRTLEIYFSVLGLTAVVLAVFALLAIPVAALFNGILGVWLGIELEVGGVVAVLAVLLAAMGFFLALGMAVGEPGGLRSILAGIFVVVAGFAVVLTIFGAVVHVKVWTVLLGPGIGISLLLGIVAAVFELFFDRRPARG
jgi:hypothetical protein